MADNIAKAFALPPEEAIKYFRSKGIAVSFGWQDIWREENTVAFTVAKMADADLLGEVREAVDKAIAEGITLQDFKASLEPLLQRRGWWGRAVQEDPLTGEKVAVQLGSASRLETIFLANVQTAYAAGAWEAIQENAGSAPYLMYDAVNDNRTRPAHLAWDGTIRPVDDGFWSTHYPPCGWRCRCSVIQMSGRQLARQGLDVTPLPPNANQTREWVNPRTGEISKVPIGVDPGWDYNPGIKTQRTERLRIEYQAALRRVDPRTPA